jgi:hypothetical protein
VAVGVAVAAGSAVATGAAGDAGIGGTGFGAHTVCNRADFSHNIDRNCWGRPLAVPFFYAAQIIGPAIPSFYDARQWRSCGSSY